tara:strand:+ start:267 stop:512 length:246 start_codon:yes stop_codon:yes gene_type:complete
MNRTLCPPGTSQELVDHPNHYKGENNPYEAIKVIEAWGADFHIGNAIKYIARYNDKNHPIVDLQKAIWYLQRKIEILKKDF